MDHREVPDNRYGAYTRIDKSFGSYVVMNSRTANIDRLAYFFSSL